MAAIRIGLIGAGQVARLHAAGYEKRSDARIHAVCDKREDIAIERALEWGAERCYTDFRDVITDPDVDAVEILTPHHLHEEMVLAALQAGKHVHVAKPISLGLATADRIIEEAEHRGLVLQVCEPTRFYPPIQEAHTFIEGGEIGNPISIRMKATIGSPDGGWSIRPESWLWRLDPARAGGGPMLMDLGYHKLATALYLMGPVEQVGSWVARTEIHPGYFLDSPTLVNWKHFGPNRFGSLELSYAPQLYIRSETYPHLESIEITGSRGVIWINRGAARFNDAAPLQLLRDGRLFSFNEVEDDWRLAFHAAVGHFVDCIHGKAEPLPGAREAKRILRFVLAAREAAAHGGTVAVGDA